MTNTQRMLDRARETCLPKTWYRLSKQLDIDSTTIYRCVHRGGTLDNAAALKLAAILEQPFVEVLSLIELDRAKTPKTKAFWENVAPRVLPSLVVAVLATATSSNLKAGTADFVNRQAIHYAKYR